MIVVTAIEGRKHYKSGGLGGGTTRTAEAPWPERLGPWGAATAPTTTQAAALRRGCSTSKRPDPEARRQQADRQHGLGFGDPGSRRKIVDQQYGIEEPAPALTLHSTPRSRNTAVRHVH